jgi:hypothetical protein
MQNDKTIKIESDEFFDNLKKLGNQKFDENVLRNPKLYVEDFRDFFVMIFMDSYVKGYTDGCSSVINDMKKFNESVFNSTKTQDNASIEPNNQV